MTKYFFLGDPKDNFSGPPAISIHGLRFVRGRGTEVPTALERKFKNHNHFGTAEEAKKAEAKLSANNNTAENDGDDFDEDPGIDYKAMQLAQLHTLASERKLKPEGDATREELIAMLRKSDTGEDDAGGGSPSPAAKK